VRAGRLRPQADARFTISVDQEVDHLFRTGERIMMGEQAREIYSRTGLDVLVDPAKPTALPG
jgi:hypothetical protein